jgi:hypothetical protein
MIHSSLLDEWLSIARNIPMADPDATGRSPEIVLRFTSKDAGDIAA